MTSVKVYSWGCYPPYSQTSHDCYWRNDIAQDVTRLAGEHGNTLAFGRGRSYGDSCLAANDHVLNMCSLDRFISVDWDTGIIVAESGVTLEHILSLAIPHGWFLPVTPGTKYVTLGGAIANDVHGKNHHVRGTFGCHVRRFSLVRSDREPMTCSLDNNADLFSATIGGLGLTGIIAWVELQLIPIESCMIDTSNERFGSLSEFFDVSNELDKNNEYSVAWVDCIAKGASAGRGIYMAGNHATDNNLEIKNKRKLTVPFTPPVSAINRFSLRLFNNSYFHLHKKGRHTDTVYFDKFFYPLDGILKWNRIYGRRGFQQFQCVIPEQNAEAATHALLDAIAKKGSGSFLAVLKRCGSIKSPGLLSFPVQGTSLALDFPQNATLNQDLFPRLDAIVNEANGRLYPAKDAHMSSTDFRSYYPNWEKIESIRDPSLCSRFWERVAIS